MDLRHDPFPPSLPQLDGARILGENMNDSMEDNGVDLTYMTFDSPEPNVYWDEATSYQSPAKSNANHVPASRPAMVGPSYSQSPESSLPDSSSSDSTNNRHKRNHSSDSSQAGAFGADGDIHMTEDTPVPNGILIGVDPAAEQANDQPSSATDVDSSNRAMECHFDFDSAASSPSPNSNPLSTFGNVRPAKPIIMPYRTSQKAGLGHGFGPYSGALKDPRETSPHYRAMRSQDNWSPAAGYPPQSSLNYAGQYISGAQLSGPSQESEWQYAVTPGPGTQNPPAPLSMFPQHATAVNFTSPATASGPAYRSQLHIGPLPPKSRVETQIPVRLTLYPPPLGITRLHLQTHTISKSKLVAKPTPEKASDMLELHAMLVCTSAMHDPIKQGRAFTNASQPQYNIKREQRRSSSGDATTPEDDESKPLNGGPVQICPGCIERERKRAARKKTKNAEEEQLWQKDEAKRIIVFNTQEVREWQHPSLPKSGESTRSNSPYNDISFPENALQVDIPMRIACYCRHQEEKEGFQVIFTIRDYQDKIVAQSMTNQIVITDDHKTHAPPGMLPPQNTILPDTTQFAGPGVFSQALNGSHQPISRNAFSTTDLQGMQQQQFNGQQLNPYAMPPSTSYTPSATLTPKNHSRQPSPSAPSGQQNKKRKASGSGRIRTDLTMTKLQTTAVPDPGLSSAGLSAGPVPEVNSQYVPDFASPQGPSTSSQFNTGPPTTPSTADSSFFSSNQRSQSMENLQGFPGMFSAPSSVRSSRVPSPTAAPYSSGLPQTHAQNVINSVQSMAVSNQPPRFPVIHKLTPGEGSKSGGIEVTCLGSGFRQGLEVIFGSAQATTTTFWGESALVCLVPPAAKACTVPVTFKHNNVQRIPSPPNKQVYFRYIDDDEQELIKHALNLVNQKWYGDSLDPSEAARRFIGDHKAGPSFIETSHHGSTQQRHMHSANTTMSGTVDLETKMLGCLNLVDLDDSPHPVCINAQGPGGQSMLHISASLGYYRLAAGLLARGANPDLRDNNGMSPMHIASLRGHLQIIRKLRSAGGDPTLRSLNGFTPADMATSQAALEASNAVDHHHTRSKSAGVISGSHLSRSSSVRSVQSFGGTHSAIASAGNFVEIEESDDDGLVGRYKSQPVTPAQAWARSRRNSLINEQRFSHDQSSGDLASNASLFAMNPAWRDQLLAQIQQLHHSLQRTLPNLQIPALPPMPNLPDYQAVRRISSLVPQRHARPSNANINTGTTKEADYRWWELFSGPSSSPPPYEEIYPEKAQQSLNDKKASALLAAGEAFMDKKCELNFDQAESSSIIETVDLGSVKLTPQQKEQLREAHKNKMKKLKSDRNLFFIWLPLLIFVLIMMLKDRVPQVWNVAGQAIRYAQGRFQERVVEVV